MTQLTTPTIEHIASPAALFHAWEEFRKGKSKRVDVRQFEFRLEERIFDLHRDLIGGSYVHGPYHAFRICDPKQRLIHKASVRDRIVHHALFAALNPLFEPSFEPHSYSCRVGKGTHRGVRALERMLRKGSRNGTRRCYGLKLDVHRFFASVDHEILLGLLWRKIGDERTRGLLEHVVRSFGESRGLPIGNLTSQLFANVYLHELDRFVKHDLRVAHYVRYTDDLVIVGQDARILEQYVGQIGDFLGERLRLELSTRKIILRKYRQGIDFLGYVLRPHCRVLRTRTKHRMFRILRLRCADARDGDGDSVERSLRSYEGMLVHASTFGLRQHVRNLVWWWGARPKMSRPHAGTPPTRPA